MMEMIYKLIQSLFIYLYKSINLYTMSKNYLDTYYTDIVEQISQS